MDQRERSTFDACQGRTDAVISRRTAVGVSGVTVLSLLVGTAFGQGEKKETDRKESDGKSRKDAQDRMEEFKAYAERMRNASPEERTRLMQEQRVQQHQRAIEDLKGQLEISDKEWSVIKPRVERVYNLAHPLRPMGGGSEQPKTDVDKASGELRELLRNDSATAEQIKAKLGALRGAKAKAAQELAAARQSLRATLRRTTSVSSVAPNSRPASTSRESWAFACSRRSTSLAFARAAATIWPDRRRKSTCSR